MQVEPYRITKSLYSLLLLIVVGTMVAVILCIGKIAQENGMPPLRLTFWMVFGAGLLLIPSTLSSIRKERITLKHIQYGLIAGGLSNAFPIVILMYAIPHIGSGMASIFYAFPPLFTYFLSALFKLEKFNSKRIFGLLLGLIGGLVILWPPGSPSINIWMMIAMLAPLFLSCANIYRTLAWPPNAQPMVLACLIMFGAAVILLPMTIIIDGLYTYFPDINEVGTWSIAGVTITMAIMYSLNMKLQKVAGPVYLSQVGYIAIPVGFLISAYIFSEKWPMSTWGALILIGLGLWLTTNEQLLAAKKVCNSTQKP